MKIKQVWMRRRWSELICVVHDHDQNTIITTKERTEGVMQTDG